MTMTDAPSLLGFACDLCPDRDPFETDGSLVAHRLKAHRLAPSQKGSPEIEEQTPAERVPLDPRALANIDQAGMGGGEQVDQSPEAILDRQVRMGGGLWDPLTMKRVVVLGGEVKVRQTVGSDAARGQAERIDYWHADFGWIREGLIPERGRVRQVSPDGTLLVT